MILEILVFSALTAGVAGLSVYDNKRMDRHAKQNEVKLREGALREIDRAGLDVSDFPMYEDALRGERHLKVKEIIDLYYTCRSRRKR